MQDKGYFLKIKAQKTQATNDSLLIPLKSKAVEILRRYDFNSPTCSTNSESAMATANETLKIVGMKAKLNTEVLTIRTEGGKMIEQVLKKWQLLSTHTGRRSFATNAWLAGVPWLSIGKITGHKSERSLLKYIKIRQEDNANILKEHSFFK